MRHALPIICLALATACAPLDARVAPTAKASKDVPANPPVATQAAGILGKMKEPVGLVRQAAFIQSLNDALPVSLVSGGLGALGGAGSVLANNGGSLVSNNGSGVISEKGSGVISDSGSSWQLLQAATDRAPEAVNIRPEGVYRTLPVNGGTSGTLEIYDVKRFDQAKPAKDQQAALMDRFSYVLVDINDLGNNRYTVEMALTVVSSKRLPFLKGLNVIQTGHPTGGGGFQNEKFEYVLGFDVEQADGKKDHADLHLTSEGADLVRAKDLNGKELPGSEAPGRMVLVGSNAQGAYAGAVQFPAGGNIKFDYTHTRKDGGKTTAALTLGADGSSEQAATSELGKLTLITHRAADGKVTLEVRTLAGDVLPSEVASDANGIATFDFGEAEKPKARLY